MMEKLLLEATKSHSLTLPNMTSLASLGKQASAVAKEAAPTSSPSADESSKKERDRTLSLEEAEDAISDVRKPA